MELYEQNIRIYYKNVNRKWNHKLQDLLDGNKKKFKLKIVEDILWWYFNIVILWFQFFATIKRERKKNLKRWRIWTKKKLNT